MLYHGERADLSIGLSVFHLSHCRCICVYVFCNQQPLFEFQPVLRRGLPALTPFGYDDLDLACSWKHHSCALPFGRAELVPFVYLAGQEPLRLLNPRIGATQKKCAVDLGPGLGARCSLPGLMGSGLSYQMEGLKRRVLT